MPVDESWKVINLNHVDLGKMSDKSLMGQHLNESGPQEDNLILKSQVCVSAEVMNY